MDSHIERILKPSKIEITSIQADEIRHAFDQKDREIFELKRSNEALESLRPHWAKGYSSDSVAAQTSAAALSQIWRILEVDNQTAAIQKLREILKY
jgi:hypothetical protein